MGSSLAGAIARLEGRFGARAVVRGAVAERQGRERRCATGTSFDALTHGGIAPGSALALVGAASSGKLSIAFRAAAGAQRRGGMVAWVDPTRSFDPVAAWRAGVELERVIVARAPGRDATLLAIGAALRGEGFRLVVADLGPGFATALSPDDLAPVLPMVRGSAAALLVTSEERSTHLAIPIYALEHVAWEQRFGRTTGWTFAVRRIGDHRTERAIFHLGSLGRDFRDVGLRSFLSQGALPPSTPEWSLSQGALPPSTPEWSLSQGQRPLWPEGPPPTPEWSLSQDHFAASHAALRPHELAVAV